MMLSTGSALDALPVSLKTGVQEQLSSSEAVLGAAYLISFRDPPNIMPRVWTSKRLPLAPERALIVTNRRVLIVEDTRGMAGSGANRQHVAASRPLETIVAIEIRSHLLDCALTLVVASSGDTERVTVEYNGVNEPDVLAAVSLIRGEIDARLRPATPDARQVDAARHAEGGLSHRQRYYLRKYLDSREHVAVS